MTIQGRRIVVATSDRMDSRDLAVRRLPRGPKPARTGVSCNGSGAPRLLREVTTVRGEETAEDEPLDRVNTEYDVGTVLQSLDVT